jgi:hypothetical protein
MTTTTSDGIEPPNIHALLLEFLGPFSHVQDVIDKVVTKIYFNKRIPKASAVVWRLAVSRIRDDERIKLFLAIAEDLDTDADLSNFGAIYNRVKSHRDLAGHSARFTTTSPDQIRIRRTLVLGPANDGKTDVVELDRNQVVDSLRDCDWLVAQMLYVVFASDLVAGAYLGDTPIAYQRPASRPEDWEGNIYPNMQSDGSAARIGDSFGHAA